MFGGPGRPGLVGFAHIAASGLHRDRSAGGRVGPPRERPEAAQKLGVVNLRNELALAHESRRKPDDGAGIARSQENFAVGPGQERENLSVVELRQGRALRDADLEELSVGAGADEQSVSGPAEREDQGLDAEDLASHAVGIDPVDGIVAGGDRLGCGGAGCRGLGRGRPGAG